MSAKVSYRTLRNDFHTHAKTCGLSPFARDLFVQCLSANIVGALQRSPKQMSKVGSYSESNASKAISELVEREICEWFPENETLWLVNCADEQVKSATAWASVKQVIATLAPAVREAFQIRYGYNPAIGYPIGYRVPYGVPPDCVRSASQLAQDTGHRKQEQEQEGAPAPALCQVAIPAPRPMDLNEIVEAINRPRRKRGLSPINAMTLHGPTAAAMFALVDMFPIDTLARIESEHESWLATATPREIADGYPWRYWLREPETGSLRAKKLLPIRKPAVDVPVTRVFPNGFPTR